MPIEISVVIPVYKAERFLIELKERLVASLEMITPHFEIILVEDCGGDRSWPMIQQLAGKDERVKGIKFSRNFGQHHGITAGLDHCRGEWVVVMDCDLQDQPEEIPKLYNEALKRGLDAVIGRRYERKDNAFKRAGSAIFYRVLEYMTDQKTDSAVANFGIYRRKVIESVQEMREQNRFFPLAVRSVGFNIGELDIEHAARTVGKSTYTFRRLMSLAANNIVSHSNKPLRFSIKVGFALSLSSLAYAAYLVWHYFAYRTPVEGWTSVMVSVYFLSGLLLANMGVLGLYIGKIFDETKGRPLYIISETVGLDQAAHRAGTATGERHGKIRV